MNKRLVTLNKSTDPDQYRQMLTGCFSQTERAIPVQNSISNRETQLVTFEVVDKSSIVSPPSIFVWFSAIRPLTLILTLGPSVCAAVFAGIEQVSLATLMAVLAILFLQVGVNLINDYNDHMSGVDRIHPNRGSRAIQKGFIRAIDVKRAAYLFLFLAIVLGVYLLSSLESQQWFFALAGLFGAVIFKTSQIQRPIVGLEELTAFLVTGPVLFHGILSLNNIEFTPQSFFVSVYFGMSASIYFHISKWQGIFEDRRRGAKSLASSLGTDLSRLVAIVAIALSVVPIIGFVYFRGFDLLSGVLIIFFSLSAVKMAYPIYRIESSFTAEIKSLRKTYIAHYWIVGLFMIFWVLFSKFI